MPSISINIATPHANEEVGRNILVTGTTDAQIDSPGVIDIQSVQVQFGESSPVQSAGSDDDWLNWLNWSCSGIAPGMRGAPVRITAIAKGRFTPIGPNPGPVRPLQASAAVVVKLDEATPPELTIPSITIRNRVEPRARTQNMKAGLEARVHDPLWLLARQWQVGEFAGRDGGSPVSMEVKSTAASFDRYATGTEPARPYDVRVPVEVLVEREAARRTNQGSAAACRVQSRCRDGSPHPRFASLA